MKLSPYGCLLSISFTVLVPLSEPSYSSKSANFPLFRITNFFKLWYDVFISIQMCATFLNTYVSTRVRLSENSSLISVGSDSCFFAIIASLRMLQANFLKTAILFLLFLVPLVTGTIKFLQSSLVLKKSKDKENQSLYDIEDIYEWIDYVREMGMEQSFK